MSLTSAEPFIHQSVFSATKFIHAASFRSTYSQYLLLDLSCSSLNVSRYPIGVRF